MSSAAVFLDRDGVLTEHVVERSGRVRPPWTRDELRFCIGARDAVDRLRRGGFVVVAVTNQPDVARGEASAASVDEINAAVALALDLDALYACPHDTVDVCECRKPQPGMLVQAARELRLDLPRSWLVGDRWVDIAAGLAAGVRTVLLETPASWAATSGGRPPSDLRPDHVVASLAQGVDLILGTHDG